MKKVIAARRGEKQQEVELTQTEIDKFKAEEAAYLAEKEYYEKFEKYKDQRKAEYKPIGDQLDAILKQLNYDRLNGRGMIQDADDTINHWLAVKAKYPKPSDK